MDRNFARALKAVMAEEGGWADNPKDPGGATMKGVTLTNFRRYVQADATKDDLRKITDAQAATVYRRFYWDAVSGNELPDGVDLAVFDFGVNSGPSRAIKYLQDVVGVTADGRIGPETLAAVRAKMQAGIINKICDERLAFMKRIRHPKTGALLWATFGKGWDARVKRIRSASLALLVGQAPAPSPVPPVEAKPVPPPPPPEEPKGFWAWLRSLFS